MQETGKINFNNRNSDIKDLSIQYSLSGLSFYRHDTKALVSVEVSGQDDAINLISTEINSGSCVFQKTNFLVYTDRFVAIPNDIYDSVYNNDYLFAKNIVCTDSETIIRTSSCNISFLTVVDNTLLKNVRLTAVNTDILNPLQYLLELGASRAAKSKKGMLFVSIFNDVLCYAFFYKRSLLALDTIVGCDFNSIVNIASLLNNQYNIDRVVSLFDEKEWLPVAFKRHSKRVETILVSDFFEQKYSIK